MTHPICYELRIHVGDEHKEQLTDLLHELDEHNFVEGAFDFEVEFEYDYEHLSRDYYGQLVSQVPVIVYSEDLDHLESLKSSLIELTRERSVPLQPEQVQLQPIADQNWRESWKASFRPIDIGGQFAILPPWEAPENFSQPHKIVIDPGMAFGTGQHETTKMCLQLLLALPSVPPRVFDVGTGSGILAIAAGMLGCKDILGCDIDEHSVEIARENAESNGVPHARFTATPIADIEETDFDLVFANIQMKPLHKIFGDIAGHTRPGGTIIVSGVLSSEIDEFRALAIEHKVHVNQVITLGHWSGIVCERPNV